MIEIMKPNELMIGDLVLIHEPECKGHRIDYISEIDDEVGADGELYQIDDIKSIPLTAEILEKNRFMKNKYGEMILDEELGTSEIYLVLEPSYDEEYYWWRVNNELITKIKSVHELQHILRLCNIDKEIEI